LRLASRSRSTSRSVFRSTTRSLLHSGPERANRSVASVGTMRVAVSSCSAGRALHIHAERVTDGSPSEFGAHLELLFTRTTSRVEHCCSPNCSETFRSALEVAVVRNHAIPKAVLPEPLVTEFVDQCGNGRRLRRVEADLPRLHNRAIRLDHG